MAAAGAARELGELEAYLGDAFDRRLLERHHQALVDELAATGDEQRLYRTSRAYLYDLTVFAMSQTKQPYLDALVGFLPPGSRVLDYGCGIGSDGLALLEAGYDVAFADFDNPSVEYLRWRLAHRGLEAEIHDLDAGPVPGHFDLAFAFDVIEHVADPFAFLRRLEAAADHVLVNFLDAATGDTPLHHPLPVRDLLRHAASRRLLSYRVHHGRSHLVLYGTQPGRRSDRLRSAVALAHGRLR